MKTSFEAALSKTVSEFLASYNEKKLSARLEALEAAQYSYLPNGYYMQLADYSSPRVGVYEVRSHSAVYRLEVLSQTARMLLFRDERFLASQVIEGDEALLAFLREHHLPLPLLCK